VCSTRMIVVSWLLVGAAYAQADHLNSPPFKLGEASEPPSAKSTTTSLAETCGGSYSVTKEKGEVGEKVATDKLEKNHVYLGFDSYFGGVFYRLTDENGKLDPRPLGEGTLLPCDSVGKGNFKEDTLALTDTQRSGWCTLVGKEGWSEVPLEKKPIGNGAQIVRITPKTDSQGKLVGSTATSQSAIETASGVASVIPGGVPVVSTALRRKPASTSNASTGFTSFTSTTLGQSSSNFSSSPTTSTQVSAFEGIDPKNPPPGTRTFLHNGRLWIVYGGFRPFIQNGQLVQEREKPLKVTPPVSVPSDSAAFDGGAQ